MAGLILRLFWNCFYFWWLVGVCVCVFCVVCLFAVVSKSWVLLCLVIVRFSAVFCICGVCVGCLLFCFVVVHLVFYLVGCLYLSFVT